MVKVKGCERPRDGDVSGHSLRVGTAQDLLIRGYDLAAIIARRWLLRCEHSVEVLAVFASQYLEVIKVDA